MHFRAIALLAGLTAVATVFYMSLWMDMKGASGRQRDIDVDSTESDTRLRHPHYQQERPIEYGHHPPPPTPQQQHQPNVNKVHQAPHDKLTQDELPPSGTGESSRGRVEEGNDTSEDEIPDNIYEDETDDEEEREGGGQPRQGTTTTSAGGSQADVGFGERNARLVAKNINAYVTFCQAKRPRFLLDGTPLASKQNTLGATGSKNDDDIFATYSAWVDHVHAKNSRTFVMEEHQRTNGNGPVFLERPPPGWVMKLAAIHEPCNRLTHTSAHCLAYLAQQEGQYLTRTQEGVDASRDPMNIHIFWRGPISDKLSLSAHAFLFTQPLDRAHLHLWIDSSDLPGGVAEDYTKNPYAAPLLKKPFSDHVTIHAWDQEAELRYSYPNAEEMVEDGTHHQSNVKPVALSDAARFLILNRNGGIYLDADVMLLRDMSPLHDSGLEFAYEWSNTQMYNTAILRLYAGSTVARRILDGAKEREKQIQNRKAAEEASAAALAVEVERQRGSNGGIKVKPKNMEFGIKMHPHRKGGSKRPSASVQMSTNLHEKNTHQRQEQASDNNLRTKKVLRNNKRALLEKREVRPDEIYHPARLREYLDPENHKIEGNGLIMMPTAIFDPLWLRIDRAESRTARDREPMLEDLTSFPLAFTEGSAVCPAQMDLEIPTGEEDDSNEEKKEHFAAGPEVFLPGAYAYHWHNSWDVPIAPESWMGRMYEAFVDFAAGRRPNLYGEWIQNL